MQYITGNGVSLLRQCRMKCVPGPEHGAIVSIAIVSIAIASIAHPRAHPGRGSQADLRRIVLQPGCIGPQSLTDRAVDSTTTTYLLASTLNPRTGGGRRGAHLKTRWETHLIKVSGCKGVWCRSKEVVDPRKGVKCWNRV